MREVPLRFFVLCCVAISFHSLAKLGGLLIKTLSKPLSKRIKHEFSRYPATQRILIGIGQTNHAVTSRLTIWSAGYSVRSIKPLEEQKALSDGAEFVGECFILFVSGSIVVWEYNRSKESERKKQAKKRAELVAQSEALQAKLHALDVRLIALEKVVKANSQSILRVGAKYVEPKDIVPIDDPPLDDQIASGGDIEEDQEPQARNGVKNKPSSWFSWWPWK